MTHHVLYGLLVLSQITSAELPIPARVCWDTYKEGERILIKVCTEIPPGKTLVCTWTRSGARCEPPEEEQLPRTPMK
jgi:hypothetical protein